MSVAYGGPTGVGSRINVLKRWLARVLVTALLGGVFVGAGSVPVAAATLTYSEGVGLSNSWSSAGFTGAKELNPGGILAFCLDIELPAGNVDNTPIPVNSGSSVGSSEDRRIINYLIFRFSQIDDPTGVQGAAYQFAIWNFADQARYNQYKEAAFNGLPNSQEQAVRNLAASLISNAEDKAIHHASVTVNFTKEPDFPGDYAEVVAEIPFQRINGNTGTFSDESFRGTMTLTNGTFANGSTTRNVWNGVTYRVYPESNSGVQPYFVEAEAEFDIPFTNEVTVYGPVSSGHQKMAPLITGSETTKSDDDRFTYEPVQPWSASASTQISSTRVDVPTVLTDDVRINIGTSTNNLWQKIPGTEDYYDLRVTNRLYKSVAKPTQQSGVPTGATLVDTVTADVSGPENGSETSNHTGSVTTPGVLTTGPGWYTWVTTVGLVPGYSVDERDLFTGYTSDYGITSETGVQRWKPEVTTQVSDDRVDLGVTLTDTLTVVGNHPAQELTVVSTLYGPLGDKPVLIDVANDSCDPAVVPAGAPVAGVVTTTVVGNGTWESPGVTLSDSLPGYYVWGETIAETEQTTCWRADFGVSSETSIAPWQPVVSTKTSELVAETGAEITDTIIVSESHPSQELTVESTLYGPYLTRPVLRDVVNTFGVDHQDQCVLDVPAGSPIVGTVTTRVTGNGEFDTDPLTLPSEGYYVWVETIAETEQTKCWRSDFGVTEETTVDKWEVRYSTAVSERSAAINSSVYDSVAAAGFPAANGKAWLPSGAPLGSAAWDDRYVFAAPDNEPDGQGHYFLPDGYGASGTEDTVEAKLTMYGPLAEEPTRVSSIPTDAPVFDTVTVPTGNGQLISNLFDTFTVDGWYTVVVSVEESDRVTGYTSDFGIPSETVKVGNPPAVLAAVEPTITTRASDNVTLGGDVFDTAIVKDLDEIIDQVTFTLFKVSDTPNDLPAQGQAVCDASTLVWESTTPVNVYGSGEYLSETYKPTTIGTFTYVETGLDTDTGKTWVGECGVAAETVSVFEPVKTPPTVTTKASEDVTLGESVFDTIIVTDPDNVIDYTTVRLFKISTKVKDYTNPVCDVTTLIETLPDVPINGTGEYVTADIAPASIGTYQFVEYSYTVIDGAAVLVSQGECGDSTETVNVLPVPGSPAEPEEPAEPGKPSEPGEPRDGPPLAETGMQFGSWLTVMLLLALGGTGMLLGTRMRSARKHS